MRVAFGPFTLDSAARQILRDGRPVHLCPKAFKVLEVLLERRPAVVTKSELQDEVWPGTFVHEANVNVVVAEIRRALADDAREARFVRTSHGTGYAFCGAALDLAGPEPAQGAAGYRRCWIGWNERTFSLVPGENVIGRDPRCGVWLDASGVSRRHACITLDGAKSTLEDLGSRNGTFLNGEKLTSPRELTDGDVIGLGPITVTFRIWSDERAPATERITRKS
jgi:DNA-binding winged helix-turn-helix (wHTH) protein